MRRRWLRIGLRGLMVLVAAVAGGIGYFLHTVRTQRDAVAAIVAAGGDVSYSWQQVDLQTGERTARPAGLAWLVDRLGPDYFGHVFFVGLGPIIAEDEFGPPGERSDPGSARDHATDAGRAALGRARPGLQIDP